MEFFANNILPLGQLFIIGIPFFYIVRTGRFFKGVALTWFLVAGWYFLLGVLLAPFLQRISKDMPDGQHFGVALLVGWWFGIVVSLPAFGLRYLILQYRPDWLKKETASENKK